MQTIITKYHGATNTKGSRISAMTMSGAKRVYVSYDHGLRIDENHAAAAHELMRQLDWRARMIGGHTKEGMVFVIDSESSPSFTA